MQLRSLIEVSIERRREKIITPEGRLRLCRPLGFLPGCIGYRGALRRDDGRCSIRHIRPSRNKYLYHRVMLVSQIALMLEEPLEDEVVAGLTSGARAASFAHRSLDGTYVRDELGAQHW